MIKLKRINTSHEYYPFVEELMQTAFPIQERRNADLQREYTDNKPHFHTLVILYKNLPIGLLTIWDLESFHYIEHFAIHEKFRNKGYGQKVIELITNEIKEMIVLEAEEPSDDITYRRIKFYQRQGFTLQNVPYQQPPYRSEDKWFPMKLMSIHERDFLSQYETIKSKIYKEAYNLCDTSKGDI